LIITAAANLLAGDHATASFAGEIAGAMTLRFDT